MKRNTPIRPWRDVGNLNRFFRILLYIGAMSFAAFWLISVWLNGAATVQPSMATGIFQHPYAFKGRIGFLTDSQALAAHIGNLLAYGWGLAAVSGIWLLNDERKADQTQANQFTIKDQKPHELKEQSSRFTMFLQSVRGVFPVWVEFESPLSRDDCLSQLRIGLQIEGGSISGNIVGTRLKARKIISYRNSFQTIMSASIYEKAGRTFIRGSFTMPLFSSLFLLFWFGAIGLVFSISIAALVGRSFVVWVSPSAPWNAAFFCAMLLAFGVGLLTFCRSMADGEQEFLLRFIKDRTDASQ